MPSRILHTPVWLAAAVVLMALMIGGFTGQMVSGRPVFTVAAAGPDTRIGFQGTFAPIVKTVTPSVVNVWSSKMVRSQDAELEPLLQDPFFRRFFGDQFGLNQQPRERKERSLGSGVVVSRDG